jgi:hypothetical protein
MSSPIVSVDGDTAHVITHFIMSHWLSPAEKHATWSYGELSVSLVRSPAGWQISRYSPEFVRNEGHVPTVNHLVPDLDLS